MDFVRNAFVSNLAVSRQSLTDSGQTGARLTPRLAQKSATQPLRSRLHSYSLILLAVIFATGLSALGCKKSANVAKRPVQTNLAYNYTYDKKVVFIADASSDLAELDQRIKELAENATTASAAVKAVAQPKIDDLRKQRVILEKKLDALSRNDAVRFRNSRQQRSARVPLAIIGRHALALPLARFFPPTV